MRIIGSCIIGVVTAIAGYPIFSPTHGFSVVNTIVCVSCFTLWNLILSKIESKN